MKRHWVMGVVVCGLALPATVRAQEDETRAVKAKRPVKRAKRAQAPISDAQRKLFEGYTAQCDAERFRKLVGDAGDLTEEAWKDSRELWEQWAFGRFEWRRVKRFDKDRDKKLSVGETLAYKASERRKLARSHRGKYMLLRTYAAAGDRKRTAERLKEIEDIEDRLVPHWVRDPKGIKGDLTKLAEALARDAAEAETEQPEGAEAKPAAPIDAKKAHQELAKIRQLVLAASKELAELRQEVKAAVEKGDTELGEEIVGQMLATRPKLLTDSPKERKAEVGTGAKRPRSSGVEAGGGGRVRERRTPKKRSRDRRSSRKRSSRKRKKRGEERNRRKEKKKEKEKDDEKDRRRREKK